MDDSSKQDHREGAVQKEDSGMMDVEQQQQPVADQDVKAVALRVLDEATFQRAASFQQPSQKAAKKKAPHHQDRQQQTEEEDSTTAGTVPEPPLLRRSLMNATTRSEPGAVSVSLSEPQEIRMAILTEMDDPVEQQQEEGRTPPSSSSTSATDADAPEVLLNATLVHDSSDQFSSNDRRPQLVVEAKPAPTGFRAVQSNRSLQVVSAVVCLVLVAAIVIPTVVLSGKANKDPDTPSYLTCGSRTVQQTDYRGTIAVTESGKPCQRWDSQHPHVHIYTADFFHGNETVVEENYCRNPEGDPKPWCYTTDQAVRWEWCDIPYCDGSTTPMQEDCGTMGDDLFQADYRGTTAVTATGKPCQPWASLEPHFHEDLPQNRPNSGLEDNHYCRNPRFYKANWCYTMDNEIQLEYCDIPRCGRKSHRKHNATCTKDCSPQVCGTESLKQMDYRGTLNTTISGKTCQRWDAQYPHRHGNIPVSNQEAGLEENYCRNPTGAGVAWCYTTDPNKLLDICAVPWCNEAIIPRRKCGTKSTSQIDYRGAITKTKSDRNCLEWSDSAEAQALGFTPDKLPDDGLIANYCRNPSPNERNGAWCFVKAEDSNSSSGTSWGYCDVPDCKECGTPAYQNEDYRGTVSTTATNRPCMFWKDKEDQLALLNYTTSDYKLYFDLEENWCRNVDGKRSDVWCFVEGGDSSEWEYCSVPDCDDMAPTSTRDTCGSLERRQADYRGTIHVTETGRECQPWNSSTPHNHKFLPEDRPSDGLDGNYCRNPDNSDKAWCHTVDGSVLWEYCDVPVCDNGPGR